MSERESNGSTAKRLATINIVVTVVSSIILATFFHFSNQQNARELAQLNAQLENQYTNLSILDHSSDHTVHILNRGSFAAKNLRIRGTVSLIEDIIPWSETIHDMSVFDIRSSPEILNPIITHSENPSSLDFEVAVPSLPSLGQSSFSIWLNLEKVPLEMARRNIDVSIPSLASPFSSRYLELYSVEELILSSLKFSNSVGRVNYEITCDNCTDSVITGSLSIIHEGTNAVRITDDTTLVNDPNSRSAEATVMYPRGSDPQIPSVLVLYTPHLPSLRE